MDAGRWMLEDGCWEIGVGSWMLEVGCWKMDAGSWMLGDYFVFPSLRGISYEVGKRLSKAKNNSFGF